MVLKFAASQYNFKNAKKALLNAIYLQTWLLPITIRKKMIAVVKYFSAVSISLINAAFYSLYCYFKLNNFKYQGFKLPYITEIILELRTFIFIIPFLVAIIGSLLLKKDSKWLEIYWHVSLIINLTLFFLCIIACELPLRIFME